ncbi:MAG: UDP-N-acetylmuramoyl-tripeptide--D-alanyl-D-alanine ligase [Candidatus Scatovivens sp.]
MEIFLLNFNFLIFFIFCYKKIRHGLHILQLENYYNDRYIKWIKDNNKNIFKTKEVILLIITIIITFIKKELGLVLNLLVLVTLAIIFKKKKEKKPFVTTSRIKRMYITLFVIFITIVFIGNSIDSKFALILINTIIEIAYIFVYIVNIINKPIEKLIRLKFILKAKEKLKENNNLKIVGITGSYGKTSTKYIVETILSKKYHTLMTPESYNTTMGVVRTINEELRPTHNLFICEMGAKYVGDIKEICDIVKPNYGILTAIGPQHLDTFKSIENVSKTKLELINSLPNDGIAFVNWEDENIKKAELSKNIVKYGLSKKADYYADNIEITSKGSSFEVVTPNKEKIYIKTKLLGKLNILNIVCGVAIADKLGLSAEQIKSGVKMIRPVEHRLELKQNSNGSIIIDDAYNSNIKGAKAAVDVLSEFKDKKRILITPGIVELGDKQYELNKDFGKYATKGCDFVILVGEKQAIPLKDGLKEAKYSEEKIYIAKNLDDGLNKMREMLDENTVVLLENDLPDNYL